MIFDRGMLARNLIKEVLVEDCYDIKSVRDNDITTVIDIGANYGIFSILSRFTWPKAVIHAVEPCAETLKGLQSNVANLDIHTYRLALGDGTAVQTRQAGVSSGVAVTEPLKEGGDAVESLRLPELLARLQITADRHTYLKVDIEGSERFLFGHEPSELLLGQLGGFGFEIHCKTSKWPTSPEKTTWIAHLAALKTRLWSQGITMDFAFGNNIGYCRGRSSVKVLK